MAKRPTFDFKLDQAPKIRQKQDWLEVAADTRALGTATLENARVLSLDHVEPGPWQVRRDFRSEKMSELVESVRSQGVLEPILVRPAEAGRYHIIAGERRYRAAREAGLTSIPALVLELDDLNARVISLMENIQRDDLNEVERAEGLVVLKQITGQTWDEVARLLGITKRHVLHVVSLTRLQPPVQELIRSGILSAKHGRLLAYVKDPQVQTTLADVVADLHLNAGQTAEAVKRIGGEPGFTAAAESGTDVTLRDRLENLAAALLHPQEPAPLPPVSLRPLALGDLQQLLDASAELRGALEAFPSNPLDPDAANSLRQELSGLVQAAQSLLSRLPAAEEQA